jgi:hypothetical protein
MKKIILFLTISSLFLTSCYKEYECIFTDENGNDTGQRDYVRAFSQKQANKKCFKNLK